MFWLSFFLGCTSQTETPQDNQPPAPSNSHPTIVLITLDTTRQDYIGTYGREKAKTPNIDHFAKMGIQFDQAYTTTPLTTPAHASILTGLYPPRHGIHSNGDAVLSEAAVTMAELLQKSGYETAASVAAFVTTRIWNLDQGFDSYFDSLIQNKEKRWTQERPANEVTDDLIKWLKKERNAPLFVWAHYYDPHHPHETVTELEEQFDLKYDAEIAFVDQQIGRLREAINKATNNQRTIWIIVADHGEGFGEHQEQKHGLFIWNGVMKIPFIIADTHNELGKVESDLVVSNVDVMPTALGLAGIDVPTNIDGKDLSALFSGNTITREPVYMEATLPQIRFGYHPELGSVHNTFKLIDTPNPRLFNLTNDPEEQNNIFGSQPNIEKELHEFTQKVWASEPLENAQKASSDVITQLSALGYVSNDFDNAISDIDAKDKLPTILKIEALRHKQKQNTDPEGLVKEFQELLEKEPQMGEIRMVLATLYTQLEQHEKALDVYKKAIELNPNSTLLKISAANTLATLKRYDEGMLLLEQVFTQVPEDDLAQLAKLKMLIDSKQYKVAIATAKEWLKIRPKDNDIRALLGIALFREGKTQLAQEFLGLSLEDELPRQFVNETLALIALSKGDLSKGIAHYEKEAAYFPRIKHHISLGNLYMRDKNWDLAIENYAKALHGKKGVGPKLRHSLSQAHFNAKQYDLAKKALQPALRNNPENPDYILLQANILAATGNREEGEKLFKKAVALKKQQSK